MVKTREMDFTKGPLLKKMLLFALPIIGVNILQLLFTAADVAVLGVFTNDNAVAAVGATSQITNLMVGFFVGLSVGANVLVARCVGAKDEDRARRLVGTSVMLSIVFGLIIMTAGLILAEKLLIWTNCDEDVLPYAARYLRIYFIGMPIVMLYNFCASILRAVGDTLRPLIFLAAGGVLNILLNIFFVVVIGIDVEGVAIATVSSQAVSAVGALVIMVRGNGYAKLSVSELKIRRRELKDIFVIGFPLGLSKCTFSFANTIIVSSLNALGEQVMTANAIVREFDAMILEALHGFTLASLAIISQNLGAKNMVRIKKTIFICLALVCGVGVVLGVLFYILGPFLCGIMTDTDIVIEYCMVRVAIVGAPYVVCGMVNVVQEGIRGLGYSNTSLMISICANIVFRLVWIWAVYPSLYVEGNIKNNYAYICLVWPASWIISLTLGTAILLYLYRKTKSKINKELSEEEKNYVKT